MQITVHRILSPFKHSCNNPGTIIMNSPHDAILCVVGKEYERKIFVIALPVPSKKKEKKEHQTIYKIS